MITVSVVVAEGSSGATVGVLRGSSIGVASGATIVGGAGASVGISAGGGAGFDGGSGGVSSSGPYVGNGTIPSGFDGFGVLVFEGRHGPGHGH